jgi:MinD superfamily P-loop ATPase
MFQKRGLEPWFMQKWARRRKLGNWSRSPAKSQRNCHRNHASYIINDGPPGIGCAAIASVTGTDLVLVVVEPSLSGLHDAKRMIELVKSFNIPVYAIINKYDINAEATEKVENFLIENQIKLVGKLPFVTEMVESMVAGKTIVEFVPTTKISREFLSVWNSIINDNVLSMYNHYSDLFLRAGWEFRWVLIWYLIKFVR